eukprot:tig00021127_g18694.t1
MDRPASANRPRSATSRARPQSARPAAATALAPLHEPRSPQEIIAASKNASPEAVAAALRGQSYPAEIQASILAAIYPTGTEAALAACLKGLQLPGYKLAAVLGCWLEEHSHVDIPTVLSAMQATPAELAAILGEMLEMSNEDLAELLAQMHLPPADLGTLLSWLPEPATNRDLGEVLGAMLEAGALSGDDLAEALFHVVDTSTGELCSFEDTSAVVEGMRLPDPAYAGLAGRLCETAEELAELARPAGPSPERLGALLDGACASNAERAAFLRALPASPALAGRALNATAALSNADAAEARPAPSPCRGVPLDVRQVMRVMGLSVPEGIGACLAQLSACSSADLDEILAALALPPEAAGAVRAASHAAAAQELTAGAASMRLSG